MVADADVVARAPTVIVVNIGFPSVVFVSFTTDEGTGMEDVALGSGWENDPVILFNL